MLLRSGMMLGLGMGPASVRRRNMSARAVRLLSLGLGPLLIQRRERSRRAACLLALALGPFSVRTRDEDEEAARAKALKKARRVAHKLRSKAKAARTKDVKWQALDRSLNTLWDHSKRPVFSPKDTLRLLLGMQSAPHSPQARAARAEGAVRATDADAADGGSTTITALLQRADLLPDLPSDDEEEAEGDAAEAAAVAAHGVRGRSIIRAASAAALHRSNSSAAIDAEVTDLVTHPAQKRIHALIFGDDIESHFAMGAAPKTKVATSAAVKSLLSAKVAQAVGIGLRTLGVSGEGAEAEAAIRTMARAVAAGDVEAAGGQAAVVTMSRMGCYDRDASAAVMADARPAVELPAAEMYVRVMVGSVPRVQERLGLLTFSEAVEDQLASAEAAAGVLLRASEEASTSALLVSLLRDVVLPAGNALNRFTKNAAAAGFRLAGLAELGAVKSAEGENLVQYIARRLVAYADALRRQSRRGKAQAALPGDAAAAAAGRGAAPGADGGDGEEDSGAGAMALLFARKELPSAEAACKLSTPAVEADVTQARAAVAKAAKALADIGESKGAGLPAGAEAEGPDHAAEAAVFVDRVSATVDALQDRVAAAEALLKRATQAFEKLLGFFGEDGGDASGEGGEAAPEPSSFFGVLLGFLQDLEEAAEKELASIKKREMRAKEEARKAERRANKEAGASFSRGRGEASPAAVMAELSGRLRTGSGPG
ncbi:hypothetical protein FNF31_04825 [Cafeteria roenbergensis]|uniref:FH2 domain-containing protein n=2 Tax=Cafeteria roenbergensis TaxID=33653 RepID=A0A5A8D3G5_CAFRO|nr:hypothetical protein FNF31_04825 [Cafeteria roenbergensis]